MLSNICLKKTEPLFATKSKFCSLQKKINRTNKLNSMLHKNVNDLDSNKNYFLP